MLKSAFCEKTIKQTWEAKSSRSWFLDVLSTKGFDWAIKYNTDLKNHVKLGYPIFGEEKDNEKDSTTYKEEVLWDICGYNIF